MDKVLFTIGYGNSAPEDFLKRLNDAKITVVMDVRRKGSKSWCKAYHAGNAMGKLIDCAGFWYRQWYFFGNRWDILEVYRGWISKGRPLEVVKELAFRMNNSMKDDIICILCSERDAYKDGVVNCHRVYVADALVKVLDEGWTVKHI